MIIDSLTNKKKILKSFIKIAAKYGWNKNSLNSAMDDVGIDSKYLPLIFPNYVLDLAELYIQLGNQNLEKQINSISDFNNSKIRDKIRICLYKRFEIEYENRLVLQNLVNYFQDPKNLLDMENGIKPTIQSLKLCFEVSDEIWKLIKDESTDYNYYTKRLILSKILIKAFFVFLKDEDSKINMTKKVIDEEIDKVMRFEKFKYKTKENLIDIKESIEDFFVDNEGYLKNSQQIFDSLPFIRLFKNKK